MAINWFPGHMAKARRQIEEILNKVDVVIEILDARIPISSHNPMLDDIVKHKPKVVVLNKKDLANNRDTQKFMQYYESQGMTPVAINGRESNLIKKIEPACVKATASIFERMDARGIHRRAIRAMIIGIPNVGKSTVINNIAGKKQAITGNKPGVTKKQQWIKAGDKMELLDTPGILWPKFEDEQTGKKLSLTGAIKDSVVPLDEVAIYGLTFCLNNDLTRFNEFYKINATPNDDVIEIYDMIGTSRGIKMHGNQIDYERVTERIIYDIRNGKIGTYTFDGVPNDNN